MKWLINLFKTDETKLKQQTLVIMINDAYKKARFVNHRIQVYFN